MWRIMFVVMFVSIIGYTQSGKRDMRTYDAVIAGTKCTQGPGLDINGRPVSQLSCDYRVGKSLHFSIAGVGDDTASILFQKADFENGDYYAKVGVLHGCVIVSPRIESRSGPKDTPFGDLAFVSPRTGKVYREWTDCGGFKELHF